MNAVEKTLLAVHQRLEAAEVPHAFGGAIALAYCILEPRATRDVDVNVFVPPEQGREVLGSLSDEIEYTEDHVRRLERDGQIRLWRRDVPVDLFFDVHEFHSRVRSEVREVPFAGQEIPMLGCAALVVFKAFFSRPRDWADIDAILEAETIDCLDTLVTLKRLLGDEHPSVLRLAAMCAGESPLRFES